MLRPCAPTVKRRKIQLAHRVERIVNPRDADARRVAERGTRKLDLSVPPVKPLRRVAAEQFLQLAGGCNATLGVPVL